MIGYNRLCNLEDFADPSLKAVIREVFDYELAAFPPEYPDGIADSKQWEIAMAVRALRDHGQLTPKARLLGVGAGTEVTSFFLTNHSREVVATDIYAHAEQWADVAPASFLAHPSTFAPMAYDARRLIPLHMDGRVLEFPDDTFDGIFSSGSIEHFGSLEAVSNAAFEIGRVLKVGGVATIATEFKLGGPPGEGWDPNVILFTPDTLQKHIIDASGLEPVDQPDFQLSDSTLSVRRDLLSFLEGTRGLSDPASKIANYPNLVLLHEGYLFCSIHLALRKGGTYPAHSNSSAAPSEKVRASVRAARRLAAERLATTAGVGRDLLSLLRISADPETIVALQQERAGLIAHVASIEAIADQQAALTATLTADLAAARDHERIARDEFEVGLADMQRKLANTEAKLANAESMLTSTESKLQNTEFMLTDFEFKLTKTESELTNTQVELAAIRTSTSWRLSAPLRNLIDASRRLARGA